MAVVFQSKRARLFLVPEGVRGNSRAVPGIASFALSGGEAPTSEIVDFEGATTLTGFPRPASIECSVTKYVPYHSVWRQINAEALEGGETQFELRFRGVTVVAPTAATVTAAIDSATGVVTFAGGAALPSVSLVDVGMFIVIDNDPYKVESVSGEGRVDASAVNIVAASIAYSGVGDRVAADVDAAAFSIEVPNLRFGPFPTAIANSDLPSAESEGGMSSTLSLRPNNKDIDWAPVQVDRANNAPDYLSDGNPEA